MCEVDVVEIENKTTQTKIKCKKKSLKCWADRVTKRSSGSFPRVGEDDLYSIPKIDLHLTLKTKPS